MLPLYLVQAFISTQNQIPRTSEPKPTESHQSLCQFSPDTCVHRIPPQFHQPPIRRSFRLCPRPSSHLAFCIQCPCVSFRALGVAIQRLLNSNTQHQVFKNPPNSGLNSPTGTRTRVSTSDQVARDLRSSDGSLRHKIAAGDSLYFGNCGWQINFGISCWVAAKWNHRYRVVCGWEEAGWRTGASALNGLSSSRPPKSSRPFLFFFFSLLDPPLCEDITRADLEATPPRQNTPAKRPGEIANTRPEQDRALTCKWNINVSIAGRCLRVIPCDAKCIEFEDPENYHFRGVFPTHD